MSAKPRPGRDDPARPGPEPRPVADPLSRIFGRIFEGVPDDEPPRPPPRSKGTPADDRPGPDGRVYFDMVPRKVRSDGWLEPVDKLVYWALVSLCWGSSRETTATNAKVRERIGGATELEEFIDARGRTRSRQVVTSGPSDDTLQRSYRRLISAGYVERRDDPLTRSTRRFVLLPIEADPP